MTLTLNAKIGGFMDFWQFRAAGHIPRANCTEINWDRHGEAAHEIFSIERRFRRCKSQFCRFKESCALWHQSGTTIKVVILPLLASLSWKRLQIGMGMLPITTSTSDKLFSRININDLKDPELPKWGVFIDFCDFRLQHTLQEWTAMKWLQIDWQSVNRNCYRLSRVSWALA